MALLQLDCASANGPCPVHGAVLFHGGWRGPSTFDIEEGGLQLMSSNDGAWACRHERLTWLFREEPNALTPIDCTAGCVVPHGALPIQKGHYRPAFLALGDKGR